MKSMEDAVPEKAMQIIPLGGVGEVGKNANLVQYDRHMVLVDAGVKFPEEEMLGVDLVIPDFGYVEQNAEKLHAILLTHGHEDHIGAVPYLLKALGRPVPIYGSSLTLGLVAARLREHQLTKLADLRHVIPGEVFKLGDLQFEFISVTHSIPDAMAIAITSPAGTILFTGDFKFDQTPAAGAPTDVPRLRELGKQGVLALLSDCVRIEHAGRTPSEKLVGETLERIIREAPGRVIFTSFASNISRLGQVIRVAAAVGRKVAVVGRSLQGNLTVAKELGYLPDVSDTLVDVSATKGLPQNKILLLVSGSQGEPTSALARIAIGDHPQIKAIEGDTVIMSATPVPGNEETVSRTIDNLFRRGAIVAYQDIVPHVHVSGHASREELREMIELVKPRFCIPIHGEYRHLVLYKAMAGEAGIALSNVLLADIGDVIELKPETARKKGSVPSGSVLIDGLALGIPHALLRERGKLAEHGILIAAIAIDRKTGEVLGGPDLLSRGLALPNESDVLSKGRVKLLQALRRYPKAEVEYGYVVAKTKETLGKFIYETTKRQPLILPIVTEV